MPGTDVSLATPLFVGVGARFPRGPRVGQCVAFFSRRRASVDGRSVDRFLLSVGLGAEVTHVRACL